MRKALVRNFSFLTASNLLLPIATMALVVAIRRLGGAELLGAYSLLMSFFLIGQTCSTAGLQILITRDVARERDAAGAYLLVSCVIGALASLLVSAILLPVFTWTVPDTTIRISFVLMALALFPTVVGQFGEAILLAFEHAEDFVIIGIVEGIVRTTCSTVLILHGHGLAAVAGTFLVCRSLAATATIAALVRRGARISLRFNRARFAELARQIPVVGAIPIVNSLFWRLDTLLLTALRGVADVGFYGASTRLLDVTRSFPQAYGRALYPLLSRLRVEKPGEFTEVCRQSMTLVFAATLPLTLATFGMADWIVRTLYGPALAPAAVGLRIVAWLMIPYALTSTLAQILFASGQQALDLRVNILAVTTNATMNLLLIPHWGFVGTAIASLVAMLVHASAQYTYVRFRIEDPVVLDEWLRIAGSAVAAVIAMLVAQSWHPFAVTALGLGCYAVGLWSTGLVNAGHLRAVRAQIALARQR